MAEIKNYTLNIDYAYGVLPNSNGKINTLFKKGDKVDGILTEKFIFNRQTLGIYAKPTVDGARVETPDGLAFIPIEHLTENILTKNNTEINDEKIVTTNVDLNNTKTKQFVYVGILVIAVLGLYNYFKNE